MEEKQPKKHRFGIVAIIVLTIFAVICDLIGLIPIAKDFTATIFWLISGLAMWKMGLGIFSGKKLAAMAISWISSMIPFVQEIPIELTAGIIAIFLITRAEEKTGISVLSSMKAGKMPSPLNAGGARLPPTQTPLNESGGRRMPNGGLKPVINKARINDINPPQQARLPATN